jgi:hypothetical protein
MREAPLSIRVGLALASAFALDGVEAPPPAPQDHLPHEGDTPIFLASTSTLNGPAGELALTLWRGSLEDVGTILMTLNHLAMTAGVVRP